MGKYDDFNDLEITLNDYVATVEIKRPPFNFFDFELIRQLAEAYERLDEDGDEARLALANVRLSLAGWARIGEGSFAGWLAWHLPMSVLSLAR